MAQPADAPPPLPTFSHASPVDAAGFTMIPNAVVLRHDLSPVAKLVYGYMGHLAWIARADAVAPAQGLIAADLGISERTVIEVLKELRRAPAAEGAPDDVPRLVDSKRRGQGLTNAYIINRPEPPTEIRGSGSADSAVLEVRDPPIPARARSLPENPSKTKDEEEPPLPPLAQPPPTVLIDGRNEPLDTLLEVCLVTNVPANQRAVAAAVVLNGRLHRTTGAPLEPGIRHLFWEECHLQAIRQIATPDDAEVLLRALQADPARFATLLAARIRKKADAYRAAMPGASCTPKALRDWWFDIDRTPTDQAPDYAHLPDV